MRTKYTCNTCTVKLNQNGKIVETQTPDSQCDVRSVCPDDGSSSVKRKEVLGQLPC